MEASSQQSSSQQVLWKDVSLILFELFHTYVNSKQQQFKMNTSIEGPRSYGGKRVVVPLNVFTANKISAGGDF